MEVRETETRVFGDLLLEIGARLMSSGANTNRIRITIQRIAESYDYEADFLITHRAIMLSLRKADGLLFFNQIKETYPLAPNFRLVSGISRLSWRTVEEQLPVASITAEVERLRSLPPYPRPLVLVMVALACSAFCRLSNGNAIEMLTVFIAALLGLLLKQFLTKKSVNPYFTVFFASFATAMICGGIGTWHPYEHDRVTLVTSILSLIPGIPLINSVSDILDGHSLNGLLRAVNGIVISFAIASGLFIAYSVFTLV